MDDEGRNLILQFIGSLTLADHMGDVADDIQYVLKKLGMNDIEWEDLVELRSELVVGGFE